MEREGLSVRHPARFVLIGSGNPEEGELRPQLLDRFGLSVEVKTPTDLATRMEVVLRRDAFDRDSKAFTTKWKRKDKAIRTRIEQVAPRFRPSPCRTKCWSGRRFCAWGSARTACAAS